MRNRADEILEAVALVLRDLKAEFGRRLELASDAHRVREETFVEKVVGISETVVSVRAQVAADQDKMNDLMVDISQQVRAIEDRLDDRKPIDLDPVHDALAALREAHEAVVARIGGTEQEAQRAKNELSRLGDVLDAFRIGQEARDTEKEAAMEAADASKAELARELSEIIGRLDDAEAKITSTNGVVEQFHDQHSKAQILLAGLSEGLVEASQEKQDLSAKIDVLNRALEQLSQATGETTGQIDALDKRIRVLDAHAVTEFGTLTQAVAAHVDRMAILETAIEAVEEQDIESRGRESALADQLAALSESQDRRAEELRSEMREAVDAHTQKSDQMLVRQAQQFISKLAENIRGERGPAGYLSRVQRWVSDYEFPEQALATHHAGLWQALRNTGQEPRIGEGSDWLLVAAGIESAHVAPDPAQPGAHTLSLRDSAGREHAVRIQVPIPRFFKTWDKDQTYRYYDSVMEDGHRWLSITDDPEGPPSRSEDWALLGMRGARGARGVKGDRGPVGPAPDVENLVEACVQKMAEGPGVPIFRYRGGWRYGTDYAPGDLVQGDRALVVCTEAHRAEKAPLAPGQQQWMILFPAGGGPEDENPGNVGRRLEMQEREIASLKQQIKDFRT